MSPELDERKLSLLRTAADILREKSFHAFGYRELAERMGLRKASIHHHFPTKEDFGVALLEYYRQNARELIERHDLGSIAPAEALGLYFGLAEAVLVERSVAVCPVEAFCVDGAELPERIQAGLRTIEADHLELLTGLLERARTAGAITFLGPAEEQAVLIGASLQGARQMARLGGAPAFRRVVEQWRRTLGLAAASDTPSDSTS